MRITKIEIQNYKSIKDPVEINLYDGLPTVLIGKNGSGKTNILEALSAIAGANGNYNGAGKELPLCYKVYICLTKEDTERLFHGKSIAAEKCEFVACSGERGKIDRIESEYLVPLLKSEVCEITDLANELKAALGIYTEQLNNIAYNEREEQPLRCFQIIGIKNSTTNYDIIKSRTEFVLKQVEDLTESIKQNFGVEDCSLKFGEVYYYMSVNLERFCFELSYVKPDLAEFEKNFITVNEAALKREIKKINKQTKESCEQITRLLHELDERAKRLKAALYNDRIMNDDGGVFYKFINEVIKCVGTKCLFLRNESSEVIFKTDDPEREYYRDNKSREILQTYMSKVCKCADNDKDYSLSDYDLRQFEEYLNKNIPEFENGMYDRISVEQSDGKLPSILLHEKSGETVALDSTSAGRRWYFTYYFIKNTLEPGDLFIIDEPAAMLHPIAQKEVRSELLELEKRGIKVVYSTHSPYLIPDEWKSVHFVFMGDDGTTVTQENKYEHLKQVTVGDVFDLQELLEKYQRCDKESVANRCYELLRGNFETISAASKQLDISVSAIESWRKSISSQKFRCPKLENIILIAEKVGLNINELL